MKKKMIALSLSLLLLSSCGSTKQTSNRTVQNPMTEQEHHEDMLNGALFGIIVFAILSAIGNRP